MIDDLRAKLSNASGQSVSVAVVFIDVRGFTSFADERESSDTAIYLSSMYHKVISEYFPNASYAKPTGDGMLIIFELGNNREKVVELVQSLIEDSVRLARGFAKIVQDDVLINFPVPSHLGIGMTRGSATKIVADGEVIDYSGRCLNVAARLMDAARPSGLVLCDSFAERLIGEELRDQFVKEDVYLKGLPDHTYEIWYLSPEVTISSGLKVPASGEVWFNDDEITFTHQEVISLGEAFHFVLPVIPAPGRLARVSATWQTYKDGVPLRNQSSFEMFDAEITTLADGAHAYVSDLARLASRLETDSVPVEEEITFTTGII
ncbi:MAG: nucleotidyl cyclase domain-containing protein [Acidimicrobiales bacterium]